MEEKGWGERRGGTKYYYLGVGEDKIGRTGHGS